MRYLVSNKCPHCGHFHTVEADENVGILPCPKCGEHPYYDQKDNELVKVHRVNHKEA